MMTRPDFECAKDLLAEDKKKRDRMAKMADLDAESREIPVEETAPAEETAHVVEDTVERPACTGCDIRDSYCQGCGKFVTAE